MPTYVYACRKCEQQLEVVQKMSDAPLTDCPKCEGGTLRRVLFPPAVVYKGSGFYTTDYRNGGSKSETKTEAKTETKSEAPAAS